MRFFQQENKKFSGHVFNMTPVIDIVFLLIIFFLVVCQFIEAENFDVAVTDQCDLAQPQKDYQNQLTTITVMKLANGEVNFAVGGTIISNHDAENLTETITSLINEHLVNQQDNVIILRIDKDICFKDAQYALAAVSESIAERVQLAVLKDRNRAAVSP